MKSLQFSLAAAIAITTHAVAGPADGGFVPFEVAHETPSTMDRFCYQMTESSFHFIDISETGDALSMSDDSHTTVDLPFVFRYGDIDARFLAVASNGTVYFEDIYMGLDNTCIPGSNSYNIDAFLSPFWDDLDPSSGGNVYFDVQGTSPTQRAIVQWDNVPRYGQGTNGVTFEVILHQGGDIEFQYQDVIFGSSIYDAGNSATVGIQGDPTEGLQWSCNQAELQDEMALTFSCGASGALRVFLYDVPQSVETCGTGSFSVDVINAGTDDESFDHLTLTLEGAVGPTLSIWDETVTLPIQESFSLDVTGRVPCTMPLGSYTASVFASFEGDAVAQSSEVSFDVVD